LSHIKKNEIDQAVSALEECIPKAQGEPSYQNYFAALYAETGRKAEAVELLKKVLLKNPDDSVARKLMAKIQKRSTAAPAH
jgi:predicted Zn-dependent protease